MEVYAAMIDRLDQNIGRLIDKLGEKGMCENILVMFVSDNGASAEMVEIEDDYGEIGTMTRWSSLGGNWANVSNTPFRYYKNYSFEGGINTPLIACWPGKVKPGSITHYTGHFIDIMATLVELTGAEYPASSGDEEVTPMQGESFLPVLWGKETTRGKPLFWEWRTGQAVRDGEWKLVREGLESDWKLYDMVRDPTETRNLASQFPGKVTEMENLFLSWKNQTK